MNFEEITSKRPEGVNSVDESSHSETSPSAVLEQCTEPHEQSQEQDVLRKLQAVKAKAHNARTVGTAGALTVVKTSKHGNRLKLGAKVMDALGDPDSVEFALSSDQIILATDGIDGSDQFPIRKSGQSCYIYNKELVDEVADHFSLSFAERTSVTFYGMEVLHRDDQVFVAISRESAAQSAT